MHRLGCFRMAAMMRGAPVVIARRGGALALIGLVAAFAVGCGETPPPTPAIVAPAISADQLVGKWGFAAYHKDEDRARTTKEAAAQCNRPYVINKGPNGGLMMNLADQKELSELVLKTGPNDRIVTNVVRTRSRRFGSIRTTQWHVGVRVVRKALIIDPVTHLC